MSAKAVSVLVSVASTLAVSVLALVASALAVSVLALVVHSAEQEVHVVFPAATELAVLQVATAFPAVKVVAASHEAIVGPAFYQASCSYPVSLQLFSPARKSSCPERHNPGLPNGHSLSLNLQKGYRTVEQSSTTYPLLQQYGHPLTKSPFHQSIV